MRFIETCRERVLTFTFEGQEIIIKESNNKTFGKLEEQVVMAEMIDGRKN